MRAVVLLRGMNTGGVRFAMRELTAALQAAGARDVRTVLASGNVLLDAASPQAAGALVRAVIADAFGLDVAVVPVDLETVRAAIREHPFARADDRHAYVVFAGDPAVLDALGDSAAEDEQVRRGDGVLHWDVAKGRTLDSAFGKRLGRLRGAVTTRNLRTLERIVAAG